MPSVPEPYANTKVSPGQLITAELFNGLQSTIRLDIAEQIKAAVAAIKNVQQAGDADKLGGQTAKELEDAIVERALAELPKRTGYQMVFKRLRKDEQVVIKHELKALPLVDAYQLDYFEVVCADGEEKEDRQNKFVNFYLYHTDEKEQKSAASPVEPGKSRITIEPTDGKHFPFKIPFEKMLDLVGVKYTPAQSLGDIVTEFWDALFGMPNNDTFDPDQYCHSPWFQKCCGEQRSVQTLKDRGNWDEIWFQMRPRKTVNFPSPLTPPVESPVTFPNNLEVVHLDFDKVAVKLLKDPFYAKELVAPNPNPINQFKINKDELKVMFLLKV
jgi:hypothetical protein